MPFILVFMAHPALEVPSILVRPMISCIREGGGGTGGEIGGEIFYYQILPAWVI